MKKIAFLSLFTLFSASVNAEAYTNGKYSCSDTDDSIKVMFELRLNDQNQQELNLIEVKTSAECNCEWFANGFAPERMPYAIPLNQDSDTRFSRELIPGHRIFASLIPSDIAGHDVKLSLMFIGLGGGVGGGYCDLE